LFKYAKVELRLSTAYHPQSDDQTERLNQCLETYLRCFVNTCSSKWSQRLSLAEFCYNSSFYSALGKTPFVAMYGREPRSFGLSMDSVDTPVQDVSEWLSNRVLMQESVRQHLIRAQQRMNRQADKSRYERQFNVGDWVYLKLQPYSNHRSVTGPTTSFPSNSLDLIRSQLELVQLLIAWHYLTLQQFT
jgi:hypothetical protein